MTHLKIDYIEFETTDMAASRAFLAKAFDWTFIDYGPDYTALANAGIDGGLATKVEGVTRATLIVLKTDDLAAAESAVTKAGGTITVPPFTFPGGRRFHFREPGGNELAVWSEK